MRVSEKKPNKYPWWVRLFFWNQKRKYGQILNPALIWGRSPKHFFAISLLYGVIERKKTLVPPALRALIMVKISQINECKFCVDMNAATLLKRAGSMEKVDDLMHWQESELFDDIEKACLEYAEAMTYHDRKVTDQMVKKLHKYFNDDGIVELTALIAFQNLSSKFNSALDIPAQGFCKTPK